jgi:hypothetical protein
VTRAEITYASKKGFVPGKPDVHQLLKNFLNRSWRSIAGESARWEGLVKMPTNLSEQRDHEDRSSHGPAARHPVESQLGAPETQHVASNSLNGGTQIGWMLALLRMTLSVTGVELRAFAS